MSRDPISPHARLSLIAAFLVLWLGSTGVLVVYGKHIDANGRHTAHALVVAERALEKSRGQEASQRLAQIANCKRSNERTVSENRSQLADWRFFKLTAKLIRASAAHARPQQRAGTLRYVVALEHDTQQKVWHHLVPNCAFAIDHPETFTLRPPVPFSSHPPSVHVLRIEPGE